MRTYPRFIALLLRFLFGYQFVVIEWSRLEGRNNAVLTHTGSSIYKSDRHMDAVITHIVLNPYHTIERISCL